ncbi:hypothetical protein ACFRAO_33975 [Streptomyces sp. NPDC056656]|uniref:hypothetical protein n=1 Tax=Streptomyces sp. NPDC056656 TaxID=3345895 RepID=UPI0036BD0C81
MVDRNLLDLLVLLGEPAEALHRLGDRAQAPPACTTRALAIARIRRGDLAVQSLGGLVHRRLVVQALKGAADIGGHSCDLLNSLLGGAVGVDVLEHGPVKVTLAR